MPKAVAFLIDHCVELFGEQVLQLLGTFPERDGSRQDSGAEESDSLHSLHDLAGKSLFLVFIVLNFKMRKIYYLKCKILRNVSLNIPNF